MLFSSLTFLTLFLPITIFLYFLLHERKQRNILLLMASLIFYAWGEPFYILWMLFLVTFDYGMIRFLTYYKKINLKISDSLFVFTIVVNLSGLLFFKYFNFLSSNLSGILKINLPLIDYLLPLGISFYTFQILSYVVDVYYGKVEVQKKWYLLMTYLSLFPQLIAGPIVRYQTIEHELEHRIESWENVYKGVKRFIFGLGKKVIIANNVALLANYAFSITDYSELSFTIAWTGSIAYALQIYFDFSGYSDMAIGIGWIFGFNFLENFNYPYIAKSITDFWRRWHISLSTWFRDYIYIPLGGNRVTRQRWLINIFIVWTLTGFWHGANWNFIIWGVYYGIVLILEKLFLQKFLNNLLIINRIYTLLIILFGWVIFNSRDFNQISSFTLALTHFTQGFNFLELRLSDFMFTYPYFFIAIIGSTPLFFKLENKMQESIGGQLIIMVLLTIILLFSIMLLVNESYNPFIYFRF